MNSMVSEGLSFLHGNPVSALVSGWCPERRQEKREDRGQKSENRSKITVKIEGAGHYTCPKDSVVCPSGTCGSRGDRFILDKWEIGSGK